MNYPTSRSPVEKLVPLLIYRISHMPGLCYPLLIDDTIH